MKKILLAVTGMSPAIVTETLYALATRETPWIPDEIHLLSTSIGCNRARLQLLHKDQAVFQKFCEEYVPAGHSIRFDESCLHTFTRDGVELDDIHNLEDSSFVADEIARFVFEMTQDENSEIHASIAGGRKIMGFLLGYSMSLYGRSQDRLSHVLVSEGYETNPNFYYPTQTSKVIYDKDGKPLDTSLAKVMLAEIPILHLRNRLPKPMLKAPANFSKLVEILNSDITEAKIEIDILYRIYQAKDLLDPKKVIREEKELVGVKAIRCHGFEIEMSDLNASFYLFMARKSRDEAYVDLENITDAELLEIKEFGRKNKKNEEEKEVNKKYAEKKTEEKEKKNTLKMEIEKKSPILNPIERFFHDRRNEIKIALLSELGPIGEKYLIKSRKPKVENESKRNIKSTLFYIDVEDIQINEVFEFDGEPT